MPESNAYERQRLFADDQPYEKRRGKLAGNCFCFQNMRSLSSYSPAQWAVVVMHMRARANLPAEEHKKILKFLKAGT